MKYQLLLLSLTSIIFASATEAHSKQYKVKVIDIEPVYHYVIIDKPSQYCSDVRMNTTAHKTNRIIAGSVVGGTIGQLSSSRDNKTKATVLGAVMGGIIGSQLVDRSPHSKISPQCISRYGKTEKVRLLTGYNYWYKMKGHTYQGFSVDKPQPYIILRKN